MFVLMNPTCLDRIICTIRHTSCRNEGPYSSLGGKLESRSSREEQTVQKQKYDVLMSYYHDVLSRPFGNVAFPKTQ